MNLCEFIKKNCVGMILDLPVSPSSCVPGGATTSREIFELYSRGEVTPLNYLSSHVETPRIVTQISDPLIARQYSRDLIKNIPVSSDKPENSDTSVSPDIPETSDVSR